MTFFNRPQSAFASPLAPLSPRLALASSAQSFAFATSPRSLSSSFAGSPIVFAPRKKVASVFPQGPSQPQSLPQPHYPWLAPLLPQLMPIEAMRHRKRVAKLNKPADQRKALLRALTTELIRHGRIKTTHARARAVRSTADHMITLAKDGSLHSRRQALGYVYDKQLVHALFDGAADRYADRNGGYTRVLRTMPRQGDNAPMAIIELV